MLLACQVLQASYQSAQKPCRESAGLFGKKRGLQSAARGLIELKSAQCRNAQITKQAENQL
jgi:hypothetical protein